MTDPAASIVLPTYNEAANMPVLIPRIVETLRAAGLEPEVIVVDDDSPDGTADAAAAMADSYPVRVIHRTTERGLATAVLTGFAAARGPVCVVMDADGSHPVEALVPMITKIRDGEVDVAVGSRNVAGGGSRDWPLFAQLKSRFAAWLASGVTSLSDPTTGFMAIRKSVLDGLDLSPIGWKIVLETVVKAAPTRVAEVPIIFSDREHGVSKQSITVFWQYVVHLASLYAHVYPSASQLLKFCTVGLVGVAVDLTTVILLKESLGLSTLWCGVGGFSAAVTTNYAFNRGWTFKRPGGYPLLSSYATYVVANLLGLAVRLLTIQLLISLTQLDRGYGYILLNAIGIVAATAVNFAGAKFLAFRSR